jgi:hypothetical protein
VAQSLPEGLEDRHFTTGARRPVLRGLVPVIILGGLMLAALLGVFGGVANTVTRQAAPDATLIVDAPATLRNGEFFEMRIHVQATAPIAEPVIAVSPGFWSELTINTMIPAASDEEQKDGMYRFTYPAMASGAAMEMKVDGQVNPSRFGGTAGEIALFDGDREIARIPLHLRVLP